MYVNLQENRINEQLPFALSLLLDSMHFLPILFLNRMFPKLCVQHGLEHDMGTSIGILSIGGCLNGMLDEVHRFVVHQQEP